MKAAIEPTFEGDLIIAEHEPLRLERGGSLQPVVVHYTTYGELNAAKDNAVLTCHALSGSARVADWWADMFGADRLFDLSRDFVIGVNVLGSCYGSTGPVSINPATGEPFGPDFPLVTIGDMVRCQAELIDHLGIRTLRMVVGGSIGGMQALRWAIDYPQRVEQAISVGAVPLSAMGLALNHIQRLAIQNDPAFDGGRYSRDNQPAGLGLARALAMCTYKSAELFDHRFGRKPNRSGEDPFSDMNGRFDVAGYLDYQQEEFIKRFDANTYITISKAMDTFEMSSRTSSDREALRRISARVVLVGISSDWLFPAADVRAFANCLKDAGVDCTYLEQVSQHGHDAFLADAKELADLLIDDALVNEPAMRRASA